MTDGEFNYEFVSQFADDPRRFRVIDLLDNYAGHPALLKPTAKNVRCHSRRGVLRWVATDGVTTTSASEERHIHIVDLHKFALNLSARNWGMKQHNAKSGSVAAGVPVVKRHHWLVLCSRQYAGVRHHHLHSDRSRPKPDFWVPGNDTR